MIDNKFVIENVEKDKIDEEGFNSEDSENEEDGDNNLKIHFTDESKNDIAEVKNGEKTHTHLVINA